MRLDFDYFGRESILSDLKRSTMDEIHFLYLESYDRRDLPFFGEKW